MMLYSLMTHHSALNKCSGCFSLSPLLVYIISVKNCVFYKTLYSVFKIMEKVVEMSVGVVPNVSTLHALAR